MVIKALRPHKRSGLDGLSSTYHKKFAEILAPLLVNAFTSILDGHSFWTETLTAVISMLPQPHMDDTSWSNYKPISLLNLDIKILAKILSNRLNSIIGSLIHKTRVGFIPSQQASDNIRHAVLLAHAACTCNILTCFISMDIRKAFDTVSWPYLQFALCRWSFGTHFLT